jgi:hypothetical protein
MSGKTVIAKPVPVSTLGPAVTVHQGTTIYSNLAVPSVKAQPGSGGLPLPMVTAPLTIGGSAYDPNGNPAAFYAVRNNRLLGPYPELRVAKDAINWIVQRELELGVDI